MDRVIKFRGLKKEKGSPETSNDWVYGNLVKEGGFAYIIDSSGKKHYVDWKTVGQFIGLLDKSKIEIYEGDIVKLINMKEWLKSAKHMQGIGEVNFQKKALRFGWDDNGVFDWGGTGSIEVIGKIYENPELINNK